MQSGGSGGSGRGPGMGMHGTAPVSPSANRRPGSGMGGVPPAGRSPMAMAGSFVMGDGRMDPSGMSRGQSIPVGAMGGRMMQPPVLVGPFQTPQGVRIRLPNG